MWGKKDRGGPRTQISFRQLVRNALLVCVLLAVFAAPTLIARACSSGQGSAAVEEEVPKEQRFTTSVFKLEPGLAIVEMTHRGEGSFVVDLLPAEPERVSAPEQAQFSGYQDEGENVRAVLTLAEKTGATDISRAVRILDSGDHVFEVKADGPWTVDVEQPRPSGVSRTAGFSGDDDTVTPFFELSSGTKEVITTSPSGGSLEISLLDSDGNEISSILPSADGSGEDPLTGVSSAVYVPEDGIYLFEVRADALWTVEISDAE